MLVLSMLSVLLYASGQLGVAANRLRALEAKGLQGELLAVGSWQLAVAASYRLPARVQILQ